MHALEPLPVFYRTAYSKDMLLAERALAYLVEINTER
jgi:hypothetical protein